MWGKIIIPMYRLWLNGLYGLYGPRCPLSSKRPINLISLSLSGMWGGVGGGGGHLMEREMWADWMLDPKCDLELWPWPWTFKIRWESCIPGMVWLIDMECKGCQSIESLANFEGWPHPWFSETGQNYGFWAFSWELLDGMTWNLTCWCILTTFRND